MTKKSLTVLLAEDDQDDRLLITEAFSFIDATLYLHVVPDGKSALDYLDELTPEQYPCLIVLDYNMPLMNGLEVLQALQHNQRYHNIPKVILTTSHDYNFRKACLQSGADKYLFKPTSYSELIAIARDLMEWCGAGIS
jgi:CheY-like chemotaxis protein